MHLPMGKRFFLMPTVLSLSTCAHPSSSIALSHAPSNTRMSAGTVTGVLRRLSALGAIAAPSPPRFFSADLVSCDSAVPMARADLS